VVREIYTLASDPLTKMSVWVAYRVTPETIGPSQTRTWRPDPWLPPTETLDPKDYDDAPGVLGIDRGHQAPLAAFSGTSFWRDTNILTNITPQASGLNQGPWQRLEARETKLANEDSIAVYVLTGPLFERMMDPMPKSKRRHRVPSGYWKLVATSDGRATAFMFDQATPREADYCAMRVAIEDLELRSRISVYGTRPGAKRSLDEKLGCPKR
jgi:endonuclease G